MQYLLTFTKLINTKQSRCLDAPFQKGEKEKGEKGVSHLYLCYTIFMPRTLRVAVGDMVYHCLNRANARSPIFENDRDYLLFESILAEGVEKFGMRIIAYCLMPNHWHLVLYPKHDDELPAFMGWISNTHTKRWHMRNGTTGQGHLYQGRYKSFVVEKDGHFLILVRYVERNAYRAKLVGKAEQWRWSSLWMREHGTTEWKQMLIEWPVAMPDDYLTWLNESTNEGEMDSIRPSIKRGRPFGRAVWVQRVSKRLGLESTLTPRGRPRKGG